ncbi:MAG: M4 family peptidase [Methylotenera sp.]|nr:M4 family peptidase [Oligoflexia bacterium]
MKSSSSLRILLTLTSTLCATSVLASKPALADFAENQEQAFSLQALSPFSAETSASLTRLMDAYSDIQKDVGLDQVTKSKHVVFTPVQQVSDEYSETTKFQSYYDGIEVMGDMALHHKSRRGNKKITNYISEFDLQTRPTLSAQQAIAIAKSRDSHNSHLSVSEAPELRILPSYSRHAAKLIYSVKLQGASLNKGSEVLIDAHSGAVIAHLSDVVEIAPIDVLAANDNCQTFDAKGNAALTDPSLCTMLINHNKNLGKVDASADRAAKNSITVLNYYSAVHGRNSYDNRGATIRSVVHLGHNFGNAFWSPKLKVMAYGDGDGKRLRDMTLGLDVAGHEITHAVTSSTANLVSMSETGALNESYSDFFGKMIENKGDWAIGKALFTDPNSKGLRFISDPSLLQATYPDTQGNLKKMPYPDNYSKRLRDRQTCDGSNDRCWVHINSTIPSYAAYLIFQALGKTKTEKLYYNVLTQRLTSTARFVDAKNATVAACQDMYDAASCSKVQQAFAKVGM